MTGPEEYWEDCGHCGRIGYSLITGRTCPKCNGDGGWWQPIEDEENEMTDQTLEHLLTEYRDLTVKYALPIEQIATLKKRITTHVRETGETAQVQGASITVTPPLKARVTWDTKALEGVAALNPKIRALRTEKWASPSIRIIVE